MINDDVSEEQSPSATKKASASSLDTPDRELVLSAPPSALVPLLCAACTGVSIGALTSTLPDLQEEVFGDNAYLYIGMFNSVHGLMLTALQPLFGALSDNYGRRRMLLVASGFPLISYFGYLGTHNLYLYEVLYMLTATQSVALSLLMATLVDIVSPGRRTLYLGANLLAFMAALAPMAALTSRLPTDIVFMIPVAALTVCMTVIFFFISSFPLGGIPRTHSSNREEVRESAGDPSFPQDPEEVMYDGGCQRTTNVAGAGGASLAGLIAATSRHYRISFNLLKHYPFLRALLVVAFTDYIFLALMAGLMVQYLKNKFGVYTRHDQALFISVTMSFLLVGLAVLLPILKRCFRTSDSVLVIVGMSAITLYLAVVALGRERWMMMAAAPLAAPMALVVPAMRAVVAARVSPCHTGAAQGILSAATGLSSACTPIVLGLFLRLTRGTVLSDAPLFIASGMAAVGLVFALRLYKELTVT